MAIRQPKRSANPFPVSKNHGRRMSEKEYLALPEEKPYLEYVDGVVLQKLMPNEDHAILVGELIIEIGLYARRNGGRVGPESRVRMPDGSGYRLPDTSFWAVGRPRTDGAPPSVVIEVRSPGQPLAELRSKCRAFRPKGVDVCWLIDPYARAVEVFEGSHDSQRLPAESALETGVMPGFSLPLSELWAALDR